MKYLTRSYVQWLGLERIPIHKPRSGGYINVGVGGCLPAAPTHWSEGVQHEGVLYEREEDGLAYVRL